MKTTPFLKLEQRIADRDRGGSVDRWQYGRQLIDAKTGRKQLPHGMLADLIKAAGKHGLRVSEREIQYRMRCAEAYKSEAEVRSALRTFGSWRGLCDAGFPPVEDDGLDPDEIGATILAADEWEQLQLEIPGLKPVISIRGRKVELVKGEAGAKVSDVAAYLDMCEQMHDSFGKTVEHIRESLRMMREGSDGDDEVNAVEAWEAAVDGDEEPDGAVS